jgi:hypothetical protein
MVAGQGEEEVVHLEARVVARGRVAGVVAVVVEAGAFVVVLGFAGVEGWKGMVVGEGVVEKDRREKEDRRDEAGGRPGMVLVGREGQQQQEEVGVEAGAALLVGWIVVLLD